MNLLTVIIVLLVIGVILYLINRFIPMQPVIKTILNVAVVIIIILWLLKGLGLFEAASKVKL
jgi:hypothetical protein